MRQNLLRNHSVLLFSLFWLLFFSNAHSQYIFQEHKFPEKLSLHPYTVIADVGEKEYSISQVIQQFASFESQQLASENDDLGFTKHHFWARSELQNPTNSALDYYLETARPITDIVELYTVSAEGKITKSVSGDYRQYAQRSFDDRRTIFKIHITPQSKLKLYLHLKSDGEVIKIPMMLRTADSFILMTSMEQFIFGIFYGILLTAAIIYLFFFFGLGDKTFLYYALYVIFIGLMQFALDGYFYQLILPGGGWFSLRAVLIFAMVAGFLLGKYSEVFLKIKRYNRTLWLMFNIVYVLSFVLILCILFIPSAFVFCYPIANVLGLLILMLIISSVIYLHFKKIPTDIFFSIGILFLILGFGIFILNNFGQVPNSFFTLNSSKFGTGLEIIFLSLSMANLIRNLKNEKNELNRLALARSEEMNELKSYFLSNISHELRTPLNAIMNLIDSIAKEVNDEKIKKDCQVIKYSSHSLLSSVNDILDFSKIEKDELKLERTTFEPVKVLEHIKNNAQIRAHDQGLQFEYFKGEGIPNLMIGDVTRLAQIVNNVLSNAIKFTSEGKICFHILAKQKLNNQATLTMIISDTGVGISKEKLGSIFGSFAQDNINNKRKFGGLGLGLYIVKTLVDMQDGKIKMDSKVGEGTTCTIMIDFEIAPDKIQEVPTIELFDLNGANILVVEDNAINQMVIKMITKKWLNTTVSYAGNGEEALEILKLAKFDIILMDLQMPVMDGYEATIAIRNGEAGAEYTNIPIIAVTADVMETTKMRVREIGMNDYLSKPLKNETLFRAVKNLV